MMTTRVRATPEMNRGTGAPAPSGAATVGPRGTLGKDALLTLAAQGTSLACGMASSIITARALGPAGRGVLALIVLTVGLVGWMLPMSVDSGLMYHVARRRASVGAALTASLVIALATGALGLLLLLGLSAALSASALRGVPRGLLLLAGTGLFCGTFATLGSAVVLGAGWVRERSLLSIAGSALSVSLMALLLLGFHLGLLGAVAAGLAAPVLVSALLATWIGRRVGMTRRVDASLLRSSAVFGLKMHPGLIAYWANLSLDRLVVNYFLGAAAVGLYGVASGLGELLWQLPAAMAIALFPRAAGPASSTAAVAARAARQATALVALGAVLLAALSPVIIPALFGRAFSGARPALLALLPGVVLFSPGRVLSSYLIAQGRQSALTWSAGLGVALTIGLDFLLIPRWGITGASVASSVAYGCTSAALAIWFTAASGVGVRSLLLPGRADLDCLRLRIAKPAPDAGEA